jgi:hypothetical protein
MMSLVGTMMKFATRVFLRRNLQWLDRLPRPSAVS